VTNQGANQEAVRARRTKLGNTAGTVTYGAEWRRFPGGLIRRSNFHINFDFSKLGNRQNLRGKRQERGGMVKEIAVYVRPRQRRIDSNTIRPLGGTKSSIRGTSATNMYAVLRHELLPAS
jgi:hypothetical protein